MKKLNNHYIDNGRYISLNEFEEKLSELSSNYETLNNKSTFYNIALPDFKDAQVKLVWLQEYLLHYKKCPHLWKHDKPSPRKMIGGK